MDLRGSSCTKASGSRVSNIPPAPLAGAPAGAAGAAGAAGGAAYAAGAGAGAAGAGAAGAAAAGAAPPLSRLLEVLLERGGRSDGLARVLVHEGLGVTGIKHSTGALDGTVEKSSSTGAGGKGGGKGSRASNERGEGNDLSLRE